MSIHKEQVCQVTLTTLNESGEGIGLWENTPVHVEGGVLGEIVKARVTEVKKTYAMAKLVKVVQVSPLRVEPDCPYYKRCTGCQILSTDYELGQVVYKQEAVGQALVKADLQVTHLVYPILTVSPESRLRSGALYHVSPAKTGIRIGFIEKDGKTVMDTLACPLQEAAHGPILLAIKDCVMSGLLPLYNEKAKKGILKSVIIKSIDPKDPSKGQQIVLNVSSERRLKENAILSLLVEAISGPIEVLFNEQGANIVELAAFPLNPETMTHQVGTLMKWMPSALEEGVTLLEDDKGWIANELLLAKVALASPEKGHGAGGADSDKLPKTWVVSTGKKGCTTPRMALIEANQPERLIWVGIRPTALAKDLKQLTETMGYHIREIQPIDTAPHMTQVTCIVLLDK